MDQQLKHSRLGKGGSTSMAIGAPTFTSDAAFFCGSKTWSAAGSDVVRLQCWATVLPQHAKRGQGQEALQLYDQMRMGRAKLGCQAFVAALKACCSLLDLERVRKIHREVVEGGHEFDLYIGTMLVDVYAKCGSLPEARHVFDNMPNRDVASWNAIILGCAKGGRGMQALELYSRMVAEGVAPTGRTFVGVLKACSTLASSEEEILVDGKHVKKWCLDQVRLIYSHVRRSGIELPVFVATMLVDVFAKCGSLVDARHVFDRMPYHDVVSWNALISGYAHAGEGGVALQLYARMQQNGAAPNDQTYVAALKACCTLAASEVKNQVVGGVFVKGECLMQVKAIHSHAAQRNTVLDLVVGNMLVDAYAKCGILVDARDVFEKMHHRDVVSWTTIIMGYAHDDKGDVALQLYARMLEDGFSPNHRTFVGALKACGCLAQLQKGKEIHALISRSGLDHTDLFVANSLVDMYCKCGSLTDALKVFDALGTKDVVTWNALMAGYAHHSDHELVFALFDRLQQEGEQPDGITFLTLLTVCSRMNLVRKAYHYFQAMREDFGITPTIEHYNCMVDVLGRAGHLEEAMQMVKSMPFQPSVEVWRCILGACRKWQNVELGRKAFKCAVMLDKNDAASYVLMSNIYARAGMHEDAKRIQEKRLHAQAWKQPGQSKWVDRGGNVHVFAVGDEHPELQDINAKLQDLFSHLKKEGYVPHLDSVLRDIPDGDKEDALCGHSEKVAIAYGLLKTHKGETINVFSNLRMCDDCHGACALISKTQGRTIVCRDTRVFHVFTNGLCSCRNCW